VKGGIAGVVDVKVLAGVPETAHMLWMAPFWSCAAVNVPCRWMLMSPAWHSRNLRTSDVARVFITRTISSLPFSAPPLQSVNHCFQVEHACSESCSQALNHRCGEGRVRRTFDLFAPTN
jgi:hypothetical protein